MDDDRRLMLDRVHALALAAAAAASSDGPRCSVSTSRPAISAHHAALLDAMPDRVRLAVAHSLELLAGVSPPPPPRAAERVRDSLPDGSARKRPLVRLESVKLSTTGRPAGALPLTVLDR
jgi:hypothetical protein